MEKIAHLIDGRRIASGIDQRTNLAPSTSQPFSTQYIAGENEVAAAVASAVKAFPAWSKLSIDERASRVQSFAEGLRRAYGEAGEETPLKRAICLEVGKPLPEADIEVLECADFSDFYCKVAPGVLSHRSLGLDRELWPSKTSHVVPTPVGVVGIIKPWNYPIELISWALVPCLLAGNTAVVKPSEKSPVTASMLADVAEASDIPDGVINFVFGDYRTGEALIKNPEIGMVSFTGSVSAGRAVAAQCGRLLKKVALELGGNDAAIVLSDVDPELAANGLVWGAFCNAGQVCVGVKRAYVEASKYTSLLERILNLTRSLREGHDYGPVIDESQLNRVERFIQDAVEAGARVLVGGQRGSAGTFFQPTVLEIPNDKAAAVFEEECFGPVLPLMRVDSADIAVRFANQSRFGLGASIWTADLKRGKDLAQLLNVGMIWINDVNVAFPQAPWGGVKDSGVGFELSAEALLEYAVLKHVSVETADDAKRAWWYPYGSTDVV